MTKFQVGKTYYSRSVCDYDCVWAHSIAKRTAKTVTLGNGKRCKIKINAFDGIEYILPLGNYSMAPMLRAA